VKGANIFVRVHDILHGMVRAGKIPGVGSCK
jgi:hypothetical protein